VRDAAIRGFGVALRAEVEPLPFAAKSRAIANCWPGDRPDETARPVEAERRRFSRSTCSWLGVDLGNAAGLPASLANPQEGRWWA
jgi:hypothetical protein